MLDRLRKLLEDAAASDGRLQAIRKHMEQGKATFADTAEYSERLSNLLGDILSSCVEQLTQPLEKETICKQLLREHYESINKALAKVQQDLDAQREIHIRPQQAAFPAERVQKVAHALEDPTVPIETIRRRANAPVANVAKSMHDDYIKENAKFRSEAGLKCWITRYTDGNCCKWCTKVAGRYEYGTDPADLWRRHDRCGCTILYDTGRTVQTLRGLHKKWEVVSERAKEYKPTILTPAQGRALQAKHKPTVLTKGGGSGIIQEKIRLYNIHNETNVGVFTAEEIEAAMQSSPIGRNASKYFTEAGMSLEMNYDLNAPEGTMGWLYGRDITVFVANHSDATEISQTIVHEIAHRQFGWTDTQENEVNCMIYDYLHAHETISDSMIAEIVADVRREYDYLPEGNLYGY